jgi:dienelactone hydrolase
LVVLGILSSKTAADATDRVAASQLVQRTFNNAPFRYRMKLLRKEDAYRVYRLTYPSPMVTPVKQNNTIPADYYLPRDMELGKPAPKRPAVICLHILDGNFELVGMLCSALASRGVPAVAFKLPYYGQRALPGGPAAMLNDPKRFLSALPQAGLDARRTVDLLASRPEIDPERIGIAGISLGGLVAATAAADEERIHRTALILAGGDLPYIVRHAREAWVIRRFLDNLPPAEKDEVQRMLRAADPLNRAAGLRDRARRGRVLMINGTEDRVIPRVCTEKLADAGSWRRRPTSSPRIYPPA